MHPCIPPLHRGEGWSDNGEKRVGVEGKEVGGLVMMTQDALLNSYSKMRGERAAMSQSGKETG